MPGIEHPRVTAVAVSPADGALYAGKALAGLVSFEFNRVGQPGEEQRLPLP